MLKNNEKILKLKIKKISSFFLTFVLVLFFLLAIRHYVCTPIYIPSESMCETLQVNDLLLMSKISYNVSKPERKDIVVFVSDQVDEKETILIKRIIGLPGDKIEMKNGNVYVNNKLLIESYAKKDNFSGTFVVPTNKYFVLGDNREDSLDSRYWDNPYVDKDDIIGKAIFKYYPKIENIYKKK